MNQSEFLTIIACNSLKAREKSCAQGPIGVCFSLVEKLVQVF